jgi:DNA-directed RNA polymerase subunit RPC12/RpoP
MKCPKCGKAMKKQDKGLYFRCPVCLHKQKAEPKDK